MSDRRFEPRNPTREPVQVHWTNSTGQAVEEPALLVNVSISGASLHMNRPITMQTKVTFLSGGVQHSAIVRYSVKEGAKYVVGVEFDQA